MKINYKKLRKAKRVGEWLKLALKALKYERWNGGYRSYHIITRGGESHFHRTELIKVIENNKKLLKRLLNE